MSRLESLFLGDVLRLEKKLLELPDGPAKRRALRHIEAYKRMVKK